MLLWGWRGRTGHPWPNTALPASMPGDPLRRTSTRPPEGAGRSRAMPAEAADRPACLAARSARLAHLLCGSGLARDGIGAIQLKYRAACIASKPAPTRGCAVSSLNLCFCCSQGNVQTTRMPPFQLGVYGGYVLGVAVIHPEYISIRYATAFYGWRRTPCLVAGSVIARIAGKPAPTKTRLAIPVAKRACVRVLATARHAPSSRSRSASPA